MTLHNEKRSVKAFIDDESVEFIAAPENKFKYIAYIMDDYIKRNPELSNREWWDKLDSLCNKSLQELKIYYQVFK